MIRTRFTIALGSALASLTIVSTTLAGGAGGVTGPAFYVDGDLYRTVGTPTNFEGTGAPDDSFDTIYDFGGLQPNVAEAKPGDRDFNGGRWMVMALSFTTSYADALASYDTNMGGNFDSAEEVEAAIAGGAATAMEVTRFDCPVIPVPRGHS